MLWDLPSSKEAFRLCPPSVESPGWCPWWHRTLISSGVWLNVAERWFRLSAISASHQRRAASEIWGPRPAPPITCLITQHTSPPALDFCKDYYCLYSSAHPSVILRCTADMPFRLCAPLLHASSPSSLLLDLRLWRTPQRSVYVPGVGLSASRYLPNSLPV